MAVSSCPLGLGLVAPNALNQSRRGGRDRQSKFYELPDNLRKPDALSLAAVRVRVDELSMQQSSDHARCGD
jgi:hypothetical protein